VSQAQYAAQVVKIGGMEGCHPAQIPMEEMLLQQHHSRSQLHRVPATSLKSPVSPPHATRSGICSWVCESFHGEVD
jgi:hypothetical protein